MVGKFVSGSGFEDVAFQSELCSSGSLNGVLSGSHYNRSWIIHDAVSEALERLLLLRFFGETRYQIPEKLVQACADPDLYQQSNEVQYPEFFHAYQTFRQSVREGKIGKPPQFWLIYLDMMRNQHMIHLAVQRNDFDLRLLAWRRWIPFYFALNLFNYARYGSYYAEVLANLDRLYPGLKSLLKNNGMSVQAQEKYPCRTAIDQRGEQTINRDAKTSGFFFFFCFFLLHSSCLAFVKFYL